MADSRELTYAAGTRPAKGQNMAIAEWPTATGPADYALFVGTDSGRRRRGQAQAQERLGRADAIRALLQRRQARSRGRRSPAARGASSRCRSCSPPTAAPISSRSRPRAASGSVMRARPTNHRRAADRLVHAGRPQGRTGDRPRQGRRRAEDRAVQFRLSASPLSAERHRGHRSRARRRPARDAAAMATGTGKTKLAIALLYRVLAAKRFRRVCFVVDRSALGNQTEGRVHDHQGRQRQGLRRHLRPQGPGRRQRPTSKRASTSAPSRGW